MLGKMVVGTALTHVLDDGVNLGGQQFRYICRTSTKIKYWSGFQTIMGALTICRRLRIRVGTRWVPRAKGPLKANNYVSEDY